jgi:hypothetical protein
MNFKFDTDNNDNFLKDKKIAITVGYFYQEIGDKLLIGAQQTLSKYGIDEKNVDIFYAPHLAFLGCLKYAFSQHLNQTRFVHQHHRS